MLDDVQRGVDLGRRRGASDPNASTTASSTSPSTSTSPKPPAAQQAGHLAPAPVEHGGPVAPHRVVEPASTQTRIIAPCSACDGVVAAEPAAQRRPGRRPVGHRRRARSRRRRSARTAMTLHEVVLVLEVPVEGAVGHAGGGDDVVDPGALVAAPHDDVVADLEQRRRGPGARAGSPRARARRPARTRRRAPSPIAERAAALARRARGR